MQVFFDTRRLDRMAEEFDPALPVIATGDFNEAALPGRTVYDRLVTNGPFADSWIEAASRSPLYATFHGYRPLRRTASGSTGS
jgi:hypothetical protein